MVDTFSLLIARQRSGTGALGSVLDQHPALKYVGEVFHPDNIGKPDNFFTHILNRVQVSTENALPSKSSDNFSTFVGAISTSGAAPVIDVKYRSLHHCPGEWRGLHERPWLLTNAISNKAPIIHLTRNNFVESYVSGRLAEANKIWHAARTDEISVNSVVVDIRKLSNYIRTSQAETDAIRHWVQEYPAHIEVDYGDLFDADGAISHQVCQLISKAFGIGVFESRMPSFKKQAPADLRVSIENFELVQQALAGTPYAWMVQ